VNKGETLEAVQEKALAQETARPAPELVSQTPAFNLVKAGERYLAVAKTLGLTALFEERLCARIFLKCKATMYE